MVTSRGSRSALAAVLATVLGATLLLGALAVGTGTAFATAPAPAKSKNSKSATPCAASAKACMDLSKNQAWLTDGKGHVTFGPVPARGGSSSSPTPVGSFKVLSKDAHFYSTEFKAPMPWSVFFYPGDAFHADNPATNSSGCVHLTNASAQRFFSTLNVGDKVQIVH